MLKSMEQLQHGLFSPKSFQSAIVMDRIFDLNLSKNCQLERFHTSGINTLDIDRVEERYLLSGGNNGALCIHDLQNDSGSLIYKPKVVCKVRSGTSFSHKFSILTVQWYPFDTGIFISSGMDNKLKIWDTNSMRPADSISLDYKATCHHMSPVSTKHSLIAVALGFPHVVLIDPRIGSQCHQLRGHKNAVSYVRWSPTCEYLLASGGVDNKIFLWDIRSAKGYLRTFDQHNGQALGSSKDHKTAHNGVIACLQFTDDGLYLVSYGSDNHVRLWDVALCKNTLVNYGTLWDSSLLYKRSMDLCCDSKPPVLFVPSNNVVYVYDLFTGCRFKTLNGHFSAVNSCVFRPTTQHLFSCANDMNILVWSPDVNREKEEKASAKGVRTAEVGDIVSTYSDDSDDWSSDEG